MFGIAAVGSAAELAAAELAAAELAAAYAARAAPAVVPATALLRPLHLPVPLPQSPDTLGREPGSNVQHRQDRWEEVQAGAGRARRDVVSGLAQSTYSPLSQGGRLKRKANVENS